MTSPSFKISFSNTDTLRTAFLKVINKFDPNKAFNKKTKVLDSSDFFIWEETDLRCFEVTKTNNLIGLSSHIQFDVIIFDPPSNKSVGVISTEYVKKFNELIDKSGVLIVKVNSKEKLEEIKRTAKSCGFNFIQQENFKAKNFNSININTNYFFSIFKKR